MSDDKFSEPRLKSQEIIGVSNIVESDERVRDKNKNDLLKVNSKDGNKDGKSLGLRIFTKFLSRKKEQKRCSDKPLQDEEVSISSSKTTDTRSSLSNESNSDYSKQQVSSKLPKFGSQLKKFMRLKNNQREIKTEEEVIIVPNVNENFPNSDNDDDAHAMRSLIPVIPAEDFVEQKTESNIENTIAGNEISDALEMPENPTINTNNESISTVLNDSSENGTITTEIIAENNPPTVFVAATVVAAAAELTEQQFGAQTEVEVQVSRRTPRENRLLVDDTSRVMIDPPFLYIQQEERRVDVNSRNIYRAERDSIVSGSESSTSVSEVADANGQSEGRDDADHYYNAVLRSQCSSGSTEGGVVSGGGGMDCLPLRPGPFHYLISEQAKSLVALQELQNEVGALLEFRDLVIETFPNLRHKMAASASASSASVMSSTTNISTLPLTTPSSRRIAEWEPGRVRRRAPREGESSSSLPRSRSNSHSGGNKHSATVQDSGFSTETSSKDSASTAIPRPPSPRPILDEAEDELWNLLDVIHRRGTRLREEVECLQGRLQDNSQPEELRLSNDVLEAVKKVARPNEDEDEEEEENTTRIEEDDDKVQVIALRREKEHLIDKVTELEAETISSRARAQELQSELEALSALRNGLEDRLRAEIDANNKTEIFAPGAQRLVPVSPSPISSPKSAAGNIRSNVSAFASVVSSNKSHKNRFRTRTIEKNVLANINQNLSSKDLKIDDDYNSEETKSRLGHLDSVLISPKEVRNVKNIDTKKIAAILQENSTLELQRHLITSTVHNQVLQTRLTEVEKTSEILTERLDKTREENDDLRFQLEERNIELEGTKARVRVLERLQQRPPTEIDPNECEIETVRGSDQGCLEPGSSTESARDHHQEMMPSPRRRPSRIPLPGSKQTAPKPPSSSTSSSSHGRNSSRESLKSLTRQPRDSSRDSLGGKSFSKTRDSSRESLNNKSLPRNSSATMNGNGNSQINNNHNNNNNNNKDGSKDSLNKSLPRHHSNSGRDSLNKSTSSLSRTRDARDSLESSGISGSPGTPPRRPPAPARRAHSLARPSVESDTGKEFTDPPSSWCSTSGSFRRSESSLYPDSLNQESSSVTGSTRVEFILGSPTRHFRRNSFWPPRYFDSIDSADLIAESLSIDEFPIRRGEALAECDSLESNQIFSDA